MVILLGHLCKFEENLPHRSTKNDRAVGKKSIAKLSCEKHPIIIFLDILFNVTFYLMQ